MNKDLISFNPIFYIRRIPYHIIIIAYVIASVLNLSVAVFLSLIFDWVVIDMLLCITPHILNRKNSEL